MKKVEIFKNHFKKLWEAKEYDKNHEFYDFLKNYYSRKGQKTELAYIFYSVIGFIDSIDQLTDTMIDTI